MTETAVSIMSVSQIANFAGLDVSTVRGEISRGKLKAFKKGGIWMANITDVVAWYANYKDRRGRPKKKEEEAPDE